MNTTTKPCFCTFKTKPICNRPAVPSLWEERARNRNSLFFLCACMYISVCFWACVNVCILFMARNQLSLAHNGNVNCPERLSPTQGEIWLGAGCIFPTPNSEMELAGLKSCPFLCSSPEQFTALPIRYSNRSSKQVSPAAWKTDSHSHILRVLSLHTRTGRFSGKGEVACIMIDDTFYGSGSTTAPQWYA